MAYKTGKREIDLTREEVLGVIAQFAESPDQHLYTLRWLDAGCEDLIIFNEVCVTDVDAECDCGGCE